MNKRPTPHKNRRGFVKSSLKMATMANFVALPQLSVAAPEIAEKGIHILGPMEGFSPHIGTISMMTWMRNVVTLSVEGLTKQQLDYLHDPNANTIGAMLMHLAANETMHQVKTFENRSYNNEEREKWDAAMRLGEKARHTIKGNDLTYYLDLLENARNKTIEEFKKRDDEWLFKIDTDGFQDQPTNNYCKWFHVCEHESNHNGQMKWIKSRLP